jgi:hypothetical protein
MTLEDVEASLVRHLYEKLQLPYGVKVYEDLFEVDFDMYSEWVVIDSLSNQLGPAPIQHYFIHIAIQNEAPNSKQKLNVLTDKVVSVLNEGTEIKVYSYVTKTLIGYMTVSDSSLSPVVKHKGGGMMRSLAVDIVYVGS